MRNTTVSPGPYAALVALLLSAALPLYATTLEDAMNAALANDSTLADAKSDLTIARNNFRAAAPLYGSSLSLSGSVSGEDPAEDTGVSGGEIGAKLSLPFAHWLSVAFEGSVPVSFEDSASGAAGSMSVSFTPFSARDTSAETALQKALVAAEYAVRTSVLAVRREYRAVLTAQAKFAWREAVVKTAQNELSRIQYLVELGDSRKSEEIDAYSELIEARDDLDTAENNLSIALQALSLRTGIAETGLSALDVPEIVEGRTLADEDAWLSASSDLSVARLSLESARSAVSSSTARPTISVGSSLSEERDWSLTAKVALSPDLFWQSGRSSAAEKLAKQERAYETTGRSVRTAWQNQRNSLAMAERNHENALRFLESAELSHTEAEILLERGESSRANLDSATANLLSARYQLQKSLESLENARDQLDTEWLVLTRQK